MTETTVDDRYEAAVAAWEAEQERRWGQHLLDIEAGLADPCTRAEFDAEADPPPTIDTFVDDYYDEVDQHARRRLP